ncbi:MAG TPA: TAT-variant-translocated molybdopterin oxidoreductase [Opitutus sp.]|nr:TAT-variant-translocated molybdopterin oxidoreductase [Opitutus sp.]
MPTPAAHSTPPDLWRSLEEYSSTPEFRARLADEFPLGATLWPSDLDRRDFLKLLGGSLALAGLAGCGGRPAEKILPYVATPENLVPGRPDFYASAFAVEGYARGILVESHEGRPTKIEGNPDHPESLGATDAMTQASVLSLYDPDRSRAPRHRGLVSSWNEFESAWFPRQRALAAGRGRGLALLTEPTTSPTEIREIHRLLDAMPAARWFQHTPLARHDLDGHQPDYDFAGADVILSIGSDFLYQHPAAIRYARAFATRRRVENGRVNLNRLYVLEPFPSITGALGDVRLPLSPARIRLVLDVVARALADGGEISAGGLTDDERHFVNALVNDLRAHPRTSVCVAGVTQDDDVRRWARAMNARLGAAGRLERYLPAIRSDADARSAGALPELVRAIDAHELETLLILGPNPVYTAPADVDFAPRLKQIPFTVHLGTHFDETAAHCLWHLAASHYLEAWSDLRAYGGDATIQQPLINPLYATRSAIEMLRLVTDPTGRSDYDIVRETWRERDHSGDFDTNWSLWLNTGIIPATAEESSTASSPALSTLASTHGGGAPPPRSSLTLLLAPDTKVLDGRYSNIPWLQELPQQLTRLTWDNALLVSLPLAARLQLANGDMVSVTAAQRTLEAAIYIMPGQAADCVALSLGYGRTRAGSVGNGRGFDAYRLRTTDAPWRLEHASLRKIGRPYPLVMTHGHFTMEGRDTVRRVTPDDLVRPGGAAPSPRKPPPSLYAAWPRGDYAWGMSIDLSTCIGCSACVLACQAENNIPSVGKAQVANEREMLWIRIDRYFSGDPINPQMLPQPVPCMQCENAPCELVCPVHATVHSSEGLNDMVYNRCVGTRYCSNNCPYKVRRFNFLDFRAPAKSPVHLQQNPDVTVRARGVMEKCTYCVQRINAGRIAAEKEDRKVRDGEIRTACQQACPVEAIVFGDLNDPHSRVNARKHEPVDYGLLADLNTRPRTTYLAKILARHDAPQAPPSSAVLQPALRSPASPVGGAAPSPRTSGPMQHGRRDSSGALV